MEVIKVVVIGKQPIIFEVALINLIVLHSYQFRNLFFVAVEPFRIEKLPQNFELSLVFM